VRRKPFRMPVQWVNRPNLDFRGFSGLIASGSVKPGDAVRVCLRARPARSPAIVTIDGDLEEAVAGPVRHGVLADEVDCSRGDVIAAAEIRPKRRPVRSHLVWMSDET
jgi:bifunctional enzyme CysN/CysC